MINQLASQDSIINLIKVDECSHSSKYLQIANAIIRGIKTETIRSGDNLPSINELSIKLDIARDTVERGYRHLKKTGIIDSVPRRGYFIKNIQSKNPLKIFLLFNKLSDHKKKIYDSIFATLGDQAIIDFYVYNNDFSLFKKLLLNRTDEYAYYVIIPHFVDGGERAHEIIDSIPKDKLLLLDKNIQHVRGEYAAVYEDFEMDIYNALTEALERLSKYHTIKIIFPENSYYPSEILSGFKCFCQHNGFSYKIINDICLEPISEGEVYISIVEEDLVSLIERVLSLKLTVGKQVGIISYNETPVKEIILNGITTISSDFDQMGMMAAELISSGLKEQIQVPFRLTLRGSL